MAKKSIAAVRKAKKVTTLDVEICLDPQLTDELRVEKRNLGKARLLMAQQDEGSAGHGASMKQVAKLEKSCAALEKKIEDATEVFSFRALGREVMGVLLKRHRPSAEQITEFHEGLKLQGLPVTETLAYDPDAFPPVLIARSCTSHEMTDQEAVELWNDDSWSAGELGQIFQGAWTVNEIIKR